MLDNIGLAAARLRHHLTTDSGEIHDNTHI
jgi:hypothetical protein